MIEKFIGESQIRAVLVNRLTKDSEDPESDVPPEISYTISIDIQYLSNKYVAFYQLYLSKWIVKMNLVAQCYSELHDTELFTDINNVVFNKK